MMTLKLIWNTQMICKMLKNIDEHNPKKKCEPLIVFDDMIADMINNKKLNLIVTELFISYYENSK